MKKTLAILLLLTIILPYYPIEADQSMQLVKEYSSIKPDMSNLKPHAASLPGYLEFIQKYDFTDLDGYDKKAATELAALGIVNGSAPSVFGADSEVKNIEAITMFIRMYGAEEAVRAKVRDANPDVSLEKLTNSFYDAYVEEAKNRALLNPDSSLPYFQKARREDIASWIVKATGIVNTNPVNIIDSAADAREISAENYPAVATLVDLGIMNISFGGKFGAKLGMRRRDFARLLSDTLDKFSSNLKVEKHRGLVLGFKNSVDNGGSYTDIIMMNENNELSSIRYGSNADGAKIGFPVLAANLEEPTAITIGMELEYLVKNSNVILARVLENGEVKSKIIMKLAASEGIDLIQGRVLSNMTEHKKTSNSNLSLQRLRLKLSDNRIVDLVEEYDLHNDIISPILVKNGSSFINVADLTEGTDISVYIKGSEVLFIQVGAEEVGVYKGIFRGFTSGDDGLIKSINMSTFDGSLLSFEVRKDTNYSVNSYRVKAHDLKVGAVVEIAAVRGVAEFVRAESYQSPEGYIPKNSRIVFAKVLKNSPGRIELKGDMDYIEVYAGLKVTKGGKIVSPSQILAGDKLKIYFDDIKSRRPSKIVIEKYGAGIEKLLKANVDSYSRARQTLNISMPYIMRSTRWQPLKNEYSGDYKLSEDVEIFDSAHSIDREELGDEAPGRQAYLVIRDNINSKEIAKLVFIHGYERKYSDKIGAYDNILNRMKLSGGKTLSYGDESIFVKQNRLVTMDELKRGQHIDVVSNEVEGKDKALLIRILSGDESLLGRVYFGTIETVNPYNLELSNYAKINDNKIDRVNHGTKRLDFSEDSLLYDATKQKLLERNEFFNGDYYKKENKKNNRGLKNKRYYGVFVTDGNDHIIAARFRHKGYVVKTPLDDKMSNEKALTKALNDYFSGMRFTKGSIASFDSRWNRVSLYDSYNYFDFHREWRANDKDTAFSLTNALIIKEDRIIEYNDLRLDDDVLVVRSDDDALILFVE